MGGEVHVGQRELTVAPGLVQVAGYEYQDSKHGLRVYELVPGNQSGLAYHYHNEQVEAFYVLDGTLHVGAPEGEYVVNADQVLFVDPGSPQRAYNPEGATDSVRVLAIGAPSVDGAQPYEPEEA